jgi:hypothetical protein
MEALSSKFTLPLLGKPVAKNWLMQKYGDVYLKSDFSKGPY